MHSTTAWPDISDSTLATVARSAAWSEPIGRIVAEQLVAVPDPIPTILRWPAPAPAATVAARIARALTVPEDPEGHAPWLRPEQQRAAGRLVTMLRRSGGALLADPVGTGKTFIALAVATAFRADAPAVAVVPAPLVDQWRERAATCGVPLEVISHVAMSRGARIPSDARILLVDESHHFRHPGTARYENLARAAVGRAILCITATPAVNRLEDLAHQLLLGVRDDELRSHGSPSLLRALRQGEVPSALGEIVVTSGTTTGLPSRSEHRSDWCRGIPEPAWLPGLDALTLADRNGIATLVRGVLVAAAASSPAALRAALGRYATLLRHARDAAAAGRSIDRASLRRFTGDAPEQLLLWELLPEGVVTDGLPLDDLDRVCALRDSIDLTAPDGKAAALEALLRDGVPTLVFTTSVATVPYLRERLAAHAPAWVTGRAAGWKHIHLPRAHVLAWFHPGAAEVQPRILIASDVAAEGLDLQRAARVVHYDLPWTAMRLAQREGRSRRLGAVHGTVEVVQMAVPEWAERRLRIGAVVRRKRRLPLRIGLAGDESPWRWRADLADRIDIGEGREGVVSVRADREGLLAALEVAEGERRSEVVGFLRSDGHWDESAVAIADALERLAGSTEVHRLELDRWSPLLATAVRAILRRSADRAIAVSPLQAAGRELLDRVLSLAPAASRARDADGLGALERLARFAIRGHTAGEALLAAEWAQRENGAILRNDDGLPGGEAVEEARYVRLVAVAVFVAERAATAPPSPA